MYGWHLYTLVLPYAEIKESRVLREGDIGNVSTCQTQNRSFIIGRTYTLKGK